MIESVKINSLIKSIFIDVASTLPVSDLKSIKTASLVISKLTENTDELSVRAAETVLNKNQEMTDSLFLYKDKTSFGQLKQASDNIIDSAASSLIAMNNNLGNETSNKSTEGLSAVSKIFNDLLNISATHLGLNQESEVKTNCINLKFIRTSSDTMSNNINLDNGGFKVPDITNCSQNDLECSK